MNDILPLIYLIVAVLVCLFTVVVFLSSENLHNDSEYCRAYYAGLIGFVCGGLWPVAAMALALSSPFLVCAAVIRCCHKAMK